MGLFSSVIHVRTADRSAVVDAVNSTLAELAFAQSEQLQLSADGPSVLPGHVEAGTKGPYYLVSSACGEWVAIIQAHSQVEHAPSLADVSLALSERLSTYSVSLAIHDGDIFCYHLFRDGQLIDRYDSQPQYFAPARLPDEMIDAIRHAPESFRPLVSDDDTIDELTDLLDDGWWAAYDSDELDFNGVPEDGAYIDEFDRMTSFGSLLKLNGDADTYPFTAWAHADGINWPDFVALRFKSS